MSKEVKRTEICSDQYSTWTIVEDATDPREKWVEVDQPQDVDEIGDESMTADEIREELESKYGPANKTQEQNIARVVAAWSETL